ncbi:MAG: acetyl-CoA C-acyltransferase [Candidatus Anoxymicrobium japonicum]|uniref:Probable acetyl-CoA acetyltransferase n=1 Tax=Candidatus Anoxymicrobium japonicum TaxID=2013648 RepID=A0A2N3G5C6_9ACTN|nr:MAG: acetyl-CoA C-acyltransferase [Candidatus Anoxymicrobium japonicum]
MTETVIVGMARTAFGRLGGSLADMPAVELGAVAIKEAVKRAALTGDQIDYVLMGQVISGGSGQMPARQASLKAGLPLEVPVINLNKVCISSISALVMADQIIRAGDADIIVAGGMESMSQGCYYVPRARYGYRMGDGKLIDGMIHDALWCAVNDWHMGEGTDRVAEEFGTTREEQDMWSARSQQRAAAARNAGKFATEIVPVEIKVKKEVKLFDQDEHIRPETTIESLAKLRPAFRKEGTVTAGNASGINDGAAVLVVASRKKAIDLGLDILGTVVSHGMVADKPEYLATVPANSIKKAIAKLSMTPEDINIYEINEAFAAVCCHSAKMLGLDSETAENINVNGGAIALGHPVGASGARIVMSMVNELRSRGGGYGAAAICGGGGQGDAVVVKVE